MVCLDFMIDAGAYAAASSLASSAVGRMLL